MGRVTRRHTVLRLGPGQDQSIRRNDTLAVEEPLEIRLNGESYLVTMRTPGHDIDLVHGLLHSESVIAEPSDVVLARYCAGAGPDGVNTYNVLDVSSGRRLPTRQHRPPGAMSSRPAHAGSAAPPPSSRFMRASPYPMNAGPDISAALILSAPDRLREQQRAFDQTGGLHAAGLIGLDSEMICVREDVGRHNAVDKVIGWAIREQLLPLAK